MYKIRLILFLMLYSGGIKAQLPDTLRYVLVVKSDTIGDLVAARSHFDDSTVVIHVESKASYQFLFSFEVNFSYKTKLASNGLVESTRFEYRFNQKLKEENRMQHTGEGYEIFMEDKKIKTLQQTYFQSALTMYFEEPDITQPILSERFADSITIEETKPHHYKVEFPTGDINHYFYKDGICQTIRIDMALTDMEIKLVDKSP